MRKMMRAIAAVLAVSAMMAGSAFAADKLIVKNAAGTADVFKVDDTGLTTATKLGLGTTNPKTSFHNAESIATAARGIMAAQHNDTSAGASIVFRKSRATEAVPVQPIASDYIGLFQAQFFTGAWDTATPPAPIYDRAAQFGFRNDGASVSAGSFPTAVMFQTGDKTVNLKEGLRVSSEQNVIVGNLGGTATGDMAATATGGFLYIPTVNGALSTCGTIPPNRTATVGDLNPGHVPVWFDTASSKICTCQGATLKCAVLN